VTVASEAELSSSTLEGVADRAFREADLHSNAGMRQTLAPQRMRQGDLIVGHRRRAQGYARAMEAVSDSPLVDAELASNLRRFHPGLVVDDDGSVDFGAQPLRPTADRVRWYLPRYGL
jgi:phosphopentomutase